MGKELRTKARQTSKLLGASALLVATLGYTPTSLAGATFKIDETKWISIGAGLRTSFTATEDASPNRREWSNDFNIDNIRLYVNGQIHKYFKFEFNTDCQTCNNGGEMRVLDVIGKFEFHPMFNIWVGRMLVPAERREMNGPFFSAVYNIFGAGTPFDPADFNLTIKSDGTSAGSFGRDDGATVWGSFFEGRLQYAAGFFRGLRGGANGDDNVLFAQRIAFNFLEVEKNPGYYTSGTYYGNAGDILTLAFSNQYQEDGAGSKSEPGDFRGTAVDLLFEKVLGNVGVITFNGEYKNYNINGYGESARLSDKITGAKTFAMFEGNAYDVSLMYLLPNKVWIGQFQPYARHVLVAPDNSPNRDMWEAGLNYVIDGHNARITLLWEYGDLLSKGLDYSSTARGKAIHSIKLGLQLQI
ncbi:MAG: hypothetical protein AXA67_02370 [Methylothermaceae bacteria B42]|nr:MAG: hypothetical protein AXA67_02370 [Methylothermaceae bacteria B42]HHJ39331.1 hypothetical protein [Methylothermaceae bacterium]